MASKAALKAIGDLLRKQKWDEVVAQSRQFVEGEPRNYQA